MKKNKDILTLMCGWILLVGGLIYSPIFLAPLVFIIIDKAIIKRRKKCNFNR